MDCYRFNRVQYDNCNYEGCRNYKYVWFRVRCGMPMHVRHKPDPEGVFRTYSSFVVCTAVLVPFSVWAQQCSALRFWAAATLKLCSDRHVTTALPYLVALLAIPSEPQDILSWRNVARYDHIIHDLHVVWTPGSRANASSILIVREPCFFATWYLIAHLRNRYTREYVSL